MNNKIIGVSLVAVILLAGSFASYNLYKKFSSDHKTSEVGITTAVSAAMVKLNSQEITNQSDGVIVGVVQQTEVAKVPSAIRTDKDDIVTKVTISIERYVYNPKNLTDKEIVIQTIGGTIGTDSMISEDSPKFEKGQRLVIFLRQTKDGAYIVFGGLQGKYIVNDDDTIGNKDERDIFADVFGRQMNLGELEKTVEAIANTATPN